MQHARDDVYCSLVARRAVARAALHLGICDMTAEALDVLGDVLLEYLARMGRTMSHSVEASGRSSAHTNVLDALRATELCTTNAVTHVHIPVRNGENNSSHNHHSERQETLDTSWKGLAAFLFGPDWYSEDSVSKDGIVAESSSGGGGGGKVGPSATANKTGWNAPYPEEIPFFPVVQHPTLIANPHSLDRETALEQLHAIVIEQPDTQNEKNNKKETTDLLPFEKQEDDDIPDSLFATWGAIQQDKEDKHTKRKRTMSEEKQDVPLSKKSKTNEPLQKGGENPSDTGRTLWLPSYYPPMPQAQTNYRTVVVDDSSPSIAESSPETRVSSDPLLVRSSLVQLDPQQERPWGAIRSPLGPCVVAGRNTDEEHVQPQIVPLGRASGSRVSRILEGSMDMGP